MKRREFIAALGGAAALWPLAARAQPAERIGRIGLLLNIAESDEDTQAMIGVLQHRLQELGWSLGRNVQIDVRWSGGDPGRLPSRAAELIALKPDVILGVSTPVVAALRHVTETVPIVFNESMFAKLLFRKLRVGGEMNASGNRFARSGDVADSTVVGTLPA